MPDRRKLMARQRGLRGVAERFIGRPASLSQLGGERDANVRVHAAGDDFVMKIGQPGTDEFARFEVALLDHLANVDSDLPVPRVVRPPSGDALQQWRPDDSPGRLVRMYAFLPGSPLRETAPTVLYEAGAMIARLDRALSTMRRPPGRLLEWDLRAAPGLRDRLAGLDDKDLAHRALDRYEESAAGVAGLTCQPIHNDANPDNVRCSPEGAITGLIDFGDVVDAPPVQDLATACAYQMATGIDSVTALVRGYHAQRSLSDNEISLLPAMIGARQVLSVALSSRKAGDRPDNAEYLLRNSAQCRAGLQSLDTLGVKRFEDVLHEAIHSEEQHR